MKRTVLTFGFTSAAVFILLMLGSIPFIMALDHRKADVMGYSSMVLSALIIFFGIRSYRENVGAGRISFGRGLSVGLLITAISCASAAIAFEIVYFGIVPDFGDKFSACMIERARDSGDTPQEIEKVASQARMLKGLYDNPLTNAALTFATSFPIGLAVSAISAVILRKR
jgi:hypothetical protein